MKETLKIFIAALGCLPLLAIGMILIGAFMGELLGEVSAPPPPQWLLVPAALLPIFTSLYIRAYKQQQESDQWLRRWPTTRRREIVGHKGKRVPETVEDLWLDMQERHPPVKNSVQMMLDNTTLWAVTTLLSLLALAYLCLWLGLAAAGR